MSPYPKPHADIRRRSKRRYVIMGCLCVTGLVLIGSLVTLLKYIAAKPVGPDVDQVAKDPILAIELDGGDPDEIDTRQGHESGAMSATADDITEASRDWKATTHDAERPVTDALDTAVDQGSAFWELRCTDTFLTYTGTKRVTIDGDPEVMLIEVQVIRVDPPRIKIALSTDVRYEKGALTMDAAPAWIDTALDDECPPRYVDLFERVRAG